MSSEFQKTAVRRIREVLGEQGIDVEFRAVPGDVPSETAQFVHDGEAHAIEVYSQTIVMLRGTHLYEVFLKREFKNERAYIESFSGRLGKYLRGDGWD